MRIVIDMQAAQASNRFRGIGRYTMAFAHAIVRNRQEHEIILALSGLFPEAIRAIRLAFDDILPQDNIRVWHVPEKIAFLDEDNEWRRHSAEIIREAFLASLTPDIVHVGSLFEGLGDSAVTSIGLYAGSALTAVTLYDLIPYIYPKQYLENPQVAAWYSGKIESLRRANLWLAISDSSRREGIDKLGLSEARTINVSADVDSCFQKLNISSAEGENLLARFGLFKPFVMYTGGIDHRKNIGSLTGAFSRLPQLVREAHQLAIVCSIQPDDRLSLEQLAEKRGLNKNDVIFTGFVTDMDLCLLYNLCALFVFPSWHEGFGLPALEAMRCGAPVIGANSSSLPEVIGWKEALFDPFDEGEIAKLMTRALTEEMFREDLFSNSRKQASKFSWDDTARQSIAAMEQLRSVHQLEPSKVIKQDRLKLAYVSPLPPLRTGIADYSAELLPGLAKYYDIDVIADQEEIVDAWISTNCSVRSTQWFIENSDGYDRVLYHFGNSEFHKHMFDLLEEIPGAVVLHDFYLSGLIAHIDANGYKPGMFAKELYSSHGYGSLSQHYHAKDAVDVAWRHPCSLSVIQNSRGVIVHSPNSLRLAASHYEIDTSEWAVIPLLRNNQRMIQRAEARKAFGLNSGDFLVCSFGMIGSTKLNHRLLNAWLMSHLSSDRTCHLAFVGENDPGVYGHELLNTIRSSKAEGNIVITGWADKQMFQKYLAAADVGVQLRTLSRGETSASALDCMNYGLATVVNAHGSMSELDDRATYKLPDEFDDEQLVQALESLRSNSYQRAQIGASARKAIVEHHDPDKCAELYSIALEKFYASRSGGLQDLLDRLGAVPSCSPEDACLVELADAIADSFTLPSRPRQLLIDVSELAKHDAKTGIQRVVRNILMQWLHNPPQGFRVEPVYAQGTSQYRYARRFAARFLDIPVHLLRDEPVDCQVGDIFLALDFQPQIVVAQAGFYRKLRGKGVKIIFLVYDLLCIKQPQYFLPGAADGFAPWLLQVAESDGAVCISQSVADDLRYWIAQSPSCARRSFQVGWFHLGADIDKPSHPESLPEEAKITLAMIKARPSFLMVGTIEPRKGHSQVLESFDHLWKAGINVSLVIVGKQGWMVEDLIDRLLHHPEINKRLFWLPSISDVYLEQVYASSACIIAASYCEGFGLPLIEAAQYSLPIIARDIPVFREVAGDHAWYFDSLTPQELSLSLKKWLDLYQQDAHPKSVSMPWLTWNESAKRLWKVVESQALLHGRE